MPSPAPAAALNVGRGTPRPGRQPGHAWRPEPHPQRTRRTSIRTQDRPVSAGPATSRCTDAESGPLGGTPCHAAASQTMPEGTSHTRNSRGRHRPRPQDRPVSAGSRTSRCTGSDSGTRGGATKGRSRNAMPRLAEPGGPPAPCAGQATPEGPSRTRHGRGGHRSGHKTIRSAPSPAAAAARRNVGRGTPCHAPAAPTTGQTMPGDPSRTRHGRGRRRSGHESMPSPEPAAAQ